MSDAPQATAEEDAPKPRLVAFIDLLGFKSALMGADAARQKAILDALREVAEQNRDFEMNVKEHSDRHQTITISPSITSFSDNVLISYDLEKLEQGGGPWLALMGIRHMATALAHRAWGFNCLVRGGVTIGNLYHKGRVAFGPGLVKAYELESEVAFYPRVIVTPAVVQRIVGVAMADGKSTDDRSMFLDTDGYWCLDYMTGYLEYLGNEDDEKSCVARRVWALNRRHEFLKTAHALADAGKGGAAQRWFWAADRFEKSMLSVNAVRFNHDGSPLQFP